MEEGTGDLLRLERDLDSVMLVTIPNAGVVVAGPQPSEYEKELIDMGVRRKRIKDQRLRSTGVLFSSQERHHAPN